MGKKRKPFSESHKFHMKQAQLGKVGESASNWKGDKAKYSALHMWIRSIFGKPIGCQNCGKKSGTQRNYHWANLSKEYKRDITDWARLCVSCHKLYDLGKIRLMI